MISTGKSYQSLLHSILEIPVIDCHDHTAECGPKYEDPIAVVIGGYFRSDLLSASSDGDIERIEDASLPLEERWPLLERAWHRSCYTGYAEVTRRVLAHFHDTEVLTLDALQQMSGRLPDLSEPDAYTAILDEARIETRLANIWIDERKVVDGSLTLPPRSRIVIGLPGYHSIRSYDEVQAVGKLLSRSITSLDEYLECCREIFQAYRDFGAVAFKDQSAYSRSIFYTNPSRSEAERVFNTFMADPRRSLSYPGETRDLDDYLFHSFMRMARDLELPVQIHTGHMAGIRNDITKTNAALLTPILELHRDVRFDLFHANWPYDGELLYLCKNYPNVTIDFCWANIIDPIYCRRMIEEAVTCVPHAKIHGYGSDFVGCPDRAWAHVMIAKENIAAGLASLVDAGYLDTEAALHIARSMLYDSPREFFGLDRQP